MAETFYKMDGAGNDFVVFDNRDGHLCLREAEVARICHRRFGVGADGLMTLDVAPAGYAFEMHYYNSDGRLGSMCGNGGRSIAALACHLGLGERLRFVAYDGPHDAVVRQWNGQRGIVDLGMHAQGTPVPMEGGNFIDTGSPHFVLEVDDMDRVDVVAEGRRWRHRTDLFPQGANIDFVQRTGMDSLRIRTYERGVEDETWACGTGVTAAAVVCGCRYVVARGGNFEVLQDGGNAIRLIGPVSLNFIGQWTFSQA